jgi:hypothetical protein
VNRSTAAVDWVYGGLRARLTILLNRSHRFDYLWLGLEDRRGTNPLNLFRWSKNERPRGGGGQSWATAPPGGLAWAHWSEKGWCSDARFMMGLAPIASQQQDQHILLTFKRRQLMSSSGGGFFGATLVDVEGLLRSTFSFKNWTWSLPAFTSCS